MRLYEIESAIREVALMVDEDGVLLPEADAAFESLQVSKEAKFENIARLIRNVEAEAEAFKSEKERLATKQKVAENTAERLRSYLKNSMLISKQDSYVAWQFRFNIGESKSIDVPDPSKLPKGFQRIKVEADKTLIKDAMKNWKKFKAGLVSVMTNKNLTIK